MSYDFRLRSFSFNIQRDEQVANPRYEHLQDFRAFGPVHIDGSKKVCNILFADGSVGSFADTNGDGYLNPGFVIPTGLSDYSNLGYSDSTQELPPNLVFSGVFLEKFRTKGSDF